MTDEHGSERDAAPPPAPETAPAFPPPVGQQSHPLPPPYAGSPPSTVTPQDLARYGPPPLPYPPTVQQPALPPVGQYYAAAYPAVPAPLKDVGVAYLLWFFLGTVGAHHFYLRRPGLGVAQLVLTLLGWLTAVILVGFLLLAGVLVWVVVDAFLMPERIRRLNHTIAMTNGVAQQQHGYLR